MSKYNKYEFADMYRDIPSDSETVPDQSLSIPDLFRLMNNDEIKDSDLRVGVDEATGDGDLDYDVYQNDSDTPWDEDVDDILQGNYGISLKQSLNESEENFSLNKPSSEGGVSDTLPLEE